MKQISLRLPDELHAQLRAAADTNRRSLHAEILWRLDAPLHGQATSTWGATQLGPERLAELREHYDNTSTAEEMERGTHE